MNSHQRFYNVIISITVVMACPLNLHVQPQDLLSMLMRPYETHPPTLLTGYRQTSLTGHIKLSKNGTPVRLL